MVAVFMPPPSNRFVVEKVASPLAIFDVETTGRRFVSVGSCRTSLMAWSKLFSSGMWCGDCAITMKSSIQMSMWASHGRVVDPIVTAMGWKVDSVGKVVLCVSGRRGWLCCTGTVLLTRSVMDSV